MIILRPDWRVYASTHQATSMQLPVATKATEATKVGEIESAEGGFGGFVHVFKGMRIGNSTVI